MRPGSPEYQLLDEVMAVHKGAGIAVLLVLGAIGRPAGTGEIASLTHYSAPSVSTALQKLHGRGWVHHFALHAGWQISSAGLQLPLFAGLTLPQPVDNSSTPGDNSAQTEKLLRFAASRGSRGEREIDSSITTTTTDGTEKLLRLQAQRLVDWRGIGAAAALAAVHGALGRGLTVEEITQHLDACARYIASPGAKSLRVPGAWAAGLLNSNLTAPTAPEPDDDPTELSRFDGFIPYAANMQPDEDDTDEPALPLDS